MKWFLVTEKVVTYCTLKVSAETAEEAIALSSDSNCDEEWCYDTDYDESLDIWADEIL